MPGELKDIAVIIDGEDPLADAVQASIALRLSFHHGARTTVFEQGRAETFEHLSWSDDLGDSDYSAVDICGIARHSDLTGELETSAMAQLLRYANENGAWFKEARPQALLERLHCTDLVVVGLPATLQHTSMPPVDDVIVKAGRPLLVVPRRFAERRGSDRTIGYHVLIAWNDSAACARTLHDAIPFIRDAAEVTLLYVDEGRNRTHTQHMIAAVSDHLARHGIRARPEIAATKGGGTPQIVLDHIDLLNVDLLVMGAFGRSRLAETLLGSTTKDLLHHIGVPILTSH